MHCISFRSGSSGLYLQHLSFLISRILSINISFCSPSFTTKKKISRIDHPYVVFDIAAYFRWNEVMVLVRFLKHGKCVFSLIWCCLWWVRHLVYNTLKKLLTCVLLSCLLTPNNPGFSLKVFQPQHQFDNSPFLVFSGI